MNDTSTYVFALKTLIESAINAMDLSPLEAMGGTVSVDLIKGEAFRRRYHCIITFDLEPKDD